MALLDDVSLKLLFVAENNAQAVLDTLVQSLTDLTGLLKDMQDLNPFATMGEETVAFGEAVDGAAESMKGLSESAQEAGDTIASTMRVAAATTTTASERMSASMQTAGDDSVAAFTYMGSRAGEALSELETQAMMNATSIADGFVHMTTEVRMAMQSVAREVAANGQEAGDSIDVALRDAAQSAQALAESMLEDGTVIQSAASEALKLSDTLQTADDTAQELAASLREVSLAGATAGVAGESGTTGLVAGESAASHGSLGSSLMMGGMNAMMGYYGMQMLAQSGMQWSNLEQMQQITKGTPQESAQMMGMLGMVGMTGSSATSFMAGLQGSLRNTFTRQVGTGLLGRNALLLEQLGIGPSIQSESPNFMLQTIGTRYQSLIHSGLTSGASQLLQLTGTTQLAPLFQQWQTAQKATQNMIPQGMTTAQVRHNAAQGMSLEAAMQKLSWGFSELAITLVPIINPLVQAFAKLMQFVMSGSSEMGRIVRILGTVLTTIAGVDLVKMLFSKPVGVMTVQAGVVNVGGAGAAAGGGMSAAEGAGAGAAAGAGGDAAAGGATGVEEAAASGGLFGGIFAALKGAFTGLMDAVGPIVKMIGGALTDAFGFLGDVIGPIVEVVGGALAAAFEFIGLPIELLIGAIIAVGVGIYELIKHWKVVIAWLGRMASDFGHWASTTGGAITHWVSRTTGDFTHWVATTSAAILHWVARTVSALVAWSGRTVSVFLQWGSRIWHAVVHALDAWTQNLTTWASRLWEAVTTAFTHWTAGLVHWAGTLWSAVATQFTRWTASLNHWAGGLWNAVSSGFLRFTQGLAHWASGLWSRVFGGGGSTSSGGGGGSTSSGSGSALSPLAITGLTTRWNPLVNQAIAGLGHHSSLLTPLLVDSIMQQQSSGLNSLNGKPTEYHDSNGTTDYGLMQINSSNFKSLGLNATSAMNPLKNITASVQMLNQLLNQYGSVSAAAYHYAGSGSQATADANQITSTMALNAGHVPLVSSAGKSTTTTHNINVTVNAATTDPLGLARQVASEIAQQVKRRGNVRMGGLVAGG